jgi:hypothetical protein
VILLLLQVLGRDEHGEVRVLDAQLLNLAVEPFYFGKTNNIILYC